MTLTPEKKKVVLYSLGTVVIALGVVALVLFNIQRSKSQEETANAGHDQFTKEYNAATDELQADLDKLLQAESEALSAKEKEKDSVTSDRNVINEFNYIFDEAK